MAAQTVRWGVLSTASIGKRSVNPAIQASRNGILAAVASRDLERARAYAGEAGIARSYGSYEALLDDPDLDAVYIPLPNAMHREWTIKAAAKGKHVLCEKPLALDVAECDDMAAAATAHGTLLMEAFMYRFHPRIEQLLALVHGGSLGALQAVRSAFTFRLTRPNNIRLVRELGGGALYDVGCYCVNATRSLVGRQPNEVAAWASWGPTGVDVSLAGMLRFGDDVAAHFDCSLGADRREFIDVGAADGSATVDSCFVPGTGATTLTERRAGQVHGHEIQGANQYVRMVEHFADCVLGNATLRYSAREAAENMAVINALYRSAREGGAPVRL